MNLMQSAYAMAARRNATLNREIFYKTVVALRQPLRVIAVPQILQGQIQMKSVVRNSVATLAFALLCVTAADAQSQAEPPQLAKQLVTGRGGNSTLRVTSSMFVSGDTLPERFTQNGENVSPPITWTKGPAGTISYVVLAEDNGVNRPEPIVH